jgi:uncharacterized protein (DUF4415 family)
VKQHSISNNSTEHLDDAPELTEADLSRAMYKVAGQTVNKSDWQQSARASLRKQRISITLDPDVLAYFKAQSGGKGYQTLINAALRDAMQKDSFVDTLRAVIREEFKHA